jgi:plastocyanin
VRTAERVTRYLFFEPSGHLDGDAVARAVGGLLLLATAGDHLDLWLTGYRFIPTIGWMFAVQFVAAFALGLALLVLVVARETAVRRAFGSLSWQQVVSGAGALLTFGTLSVYLLSLSIGVFGYHEIRTTAGIFAGSLEIVTFVVLGRVACEGLRPGTPAAPARMVLTSVAVTLLIVAEAAAVLPATAAGRLSAAPGVGAADPPAAQADATVVTILIENFKFVPADPVVRPGEELLVKNEDGVVHTFSTLPGTTGPEAFTTGAILPGRSAVLRAPSRPGRYPFVCLVHQFMKGTLVVAGSP